MKKLFEYPIKFQKSILAIIIAVIVLQLSAYIAYYAQYGSMIDIQVYLQSIFGNITIYMPVIVFFVILLIIKNKTTPLLSSLFDASMWTLLWLLVLANFGLIINTFFSSIYTSSDMFMGTPLYVVEIYIVSLIIAAIFFAKYLTLKSEKETKKFLPVFKIAFTVFALVPMITSLPYQVLSGNSDFITITSYLVAIFAVLIPGYLLLGKTDFLSKIFTISIGAFYAMMFFGIVQMPFTVSTSDILKNAVVILGLIASIGWFNLTMSYAKKTAR